MCKEKLLLIFPGVGNAGGQSGQRLSRSGTRVCVENKVAFLLLCCFWSVPSGKLTSQRGERMRRVRGPGEQWMSSCRLAGGSIPDPQFPNWECLPWLKASPSVEPHPTTMQTSLPVSLLPLLLILFSMHVPVGPPFLNCFPLSSASPSVHLSILWTLGLLPTFSLLCNIGALGKNAVSSHSGRSCNK